MKKTLAIVMVVLLAISVLAACNSSTKIENGKDSEPQTGGQKENSGGSQGITTNEIDFEVVEDIKSLSDKILNAIEGLKVQRGYAFFVQGGEYVLFISMGEKNTGGYSIKVKSVEDIEGLTKVMVEEKSPGKDDMVTQAITYPYTIVKVKGVPENFKVVNEKGEEFKLLTVDGSSGPDTSKTYELTDFENVTGEYVGQIDGISVEIKIEDGPVAFEYDEKLKKIIEELEEGDIVEIDYSKQEGKRPILTGISKLGSKDEYIRIVGTYNGQIDSNSIEIDIDDDLAIEGNDKPMAFRLSEDVKPYFDINSKDYKELKEGEQVMFNFYRDEHDQMVITEIEKL